MEKITSHRIRKTKTHHKKQQHDFDDTTITFILITIVNIIKNKVEQKQKDRAESIGRVKG